MKKRENRKIFEQLVKESEKIDRRIQMLIFEKEKLRGALAALEEDYKKEKSVNVETGKVV